MGFPGVHYQKSSSTSCMVYLSDEATHAWIASEPISTQLCLWAASEPKRCCRIHETPATITPGCHGWISLGPDGRPLSRATLPGLGRRMAWLGDALVLVSGPPIHGREHGLLDLRPENSAGGIGRELRVSACRNTLPAPHHTTIPTL